MRLAAVVMSIAPLGIDEFPMPGKSAAITVNRGAIAAAKGLHIREPVDIVLDTVGGEVQRGSFDILKRGGNLISVVSPPDEAMAQRYAVNAQFFYVDVNTADLQNIARALDAKTIRPNVGTVLPLADVRIAHEMLSGDRPHPRGKIVLRVRDGEHWYASA
jgi:NADPH:quinone reductase-like Zn-dependent oxidoreductase